MAPDPRPPTMSPLALPRRPRRLAAPVLVFAVVLTAACSASAVESAPVSAFDGDTIHWLDAQLTETLPWLGIAVFDNALWRYLFALVTLLVIVLLRRRVMKLVIRGLREITERTETTVDDQLVDALNPPLGYFLAVVGVFIASNWLVLSPWMAGAMWTMVRLAAIICVGWALLRCTRLLTQLFENLAKKTESELDDHLVPLVSRIVRVAIFLVIVVLAIQELGFNVTGLLTGLGVGGLAFALAAKDTLANWFGALMIYTDRPFDVGDWVKTPALEGVVEEIGLRSTRIRTFSKTVISVPNSSLANDVIENFSRMPIRRVFFNLGVTYSTTPAMMREAVARIEDILRAHEGVDQSFWMVKFTDFGDSALRIMLYYFTSTTNWARYLEIRGEINLMIMDALAEIGVGIAFPSQSIYLEKVDKEELRRLDSRARELYGQRVRIDDGHEEKVAPADDLDG